MQKLMTVLRVVLCVLLLFVAYLLESSLGARVSVLGVHVDVMPLIVAGAGGMLGAGAGMVCGLAAGMLYDLGGLTVQGLYPLYYMLWGIAAGIYGERHPERKFNQMLIIGTLMIAALAGLRYLFYLQFITDSGFVFFAQGIVAQILVNVVLSPLVFLLVRGAARCFRRFEKGGSYGAS